MRVEKVEPMNISQAKRSILQAMKLYFQKGKDGGYSMDRRRVRPICLMGPTGIGKTEIVRQAAQEMEVALVSYSITHHTRQSLIGLPRLVEEEIEGQRVSVTEYTMSEVISEMYRVMKETGKTEGILFLDEFNCASESVWPIMLQLLQEKTLGNHVLPEGWMLVLAGNPVEYNAGAVELDTVIADRLRMIWIEPDYEVWKEYAQKKGIHGTVLSYLNIHREHFYVCKNSFVDPRTVTARGWEDLSVMLYEMEKKDFPVTVPMISQYLKDGEIVRSFYTYYHQYKKFMVSGIQEKILSGSAEAVELLKQMPFAEKWSIVSALVDTLHAMAVDVAEMDKIARFTLWKLRKARTNRENEDSLQMKLYALAEREWERKVKELLIQWSGAVEEADSDWDMLRKMFADTVVLPMKVKRQELAEALAHIIYVFRESQLESHHLQYLFNELAEDEEILQVVLQCDVPEMKKLFEDIFFNQDDETDQLMADIQRM